MIENGEPVQGSPFVLLWEVKPDEEAILNFSGNLYHPYGLRRTQKHSYSAVISQPSKYYKNSYKNSYRNIHCNSNHYSNDNHHIYSNNYTHSHTNKNPAHATTSHPNLYTISDLCSKKDRFCLFNDRQFFVFHGFLCGWILLHQPQDYFVRGRTIDCWQSSKNAIAK